jgi:hypothetical protein
MHNRSVGLIAAVVGIGLAVACGGNTYTEVAPDDETGGDGGDTNAGTGGTAGKGGTGGAGKGGSAGTAGKGGTGGIAGQGGETSGTTLTVVIGAAPDGTAPEVTIQGPGGFEETITETTTFSNVAPGTYTITSDVESVRVDGAIVDSIFDLGIDGSPAEVDGDDVTIEVAWNQRPGTGMLWLGNFGSRRVLGYTEDQLEQSNASLTPAVTLNLPALGTSGAHAGAIAFDASGTLWAGYCKGLSESPQAFAAFAPDQLASSGTPTAKVVIETPVGAEFDCVSALAPAPDGGLWVGFVDGTIAKYTAEQLETSGAPTPAVSIGTKVTSILGDLLLDPNGNLWTAAYGSNRISKFLPEQLDETNPNVTPDVTWAFGTAHGPVGLALSPTTQTLWAAFYDARYVAEFDPGLASGTDPTETTTIDSSVFAGGPELLTFDEQGNLWVSLYDSDEFARIDAADLATGVQTPSVVIGGSQINTAYALRFNPPAE